MSQDTPDSMASFVRVLLALWALFMLTAVAQASAGRTLLQPGAGILYHSEELLC